MNEKHKIIERTESMTWEERKAMRVNENGSHAWCEAKQLYDMNSFEQTVYYYLDGTSVEVREPRTPLTGNVLALPENLAWIGTEDGGITIGCRNEPGKQPEWIPFQPPEDIG